MSRFYKYTGSSFPWSVKTERDYPVLEVLIDAVIIPFTAATTTAFESFFDTLSQGDDVIYDDLKDYIEAETVPIFLSIAKQGESHGLVDITIDSGEIAVAGDVTDGH